MGKSEISGRTKILEALARHPAGLNAAKIKEIVCKEYAITPEALAGSLVQLAKEGKITNRGKHACKLCAVHSTVYKLGKSV